MEVENDFEKSLNKLECPFTWDMDDIDRSLSADYKPHDEEDLIPLLKLFRQIMVVYVQTKENENADMIMNNLQKIDGIMFAVAEQPDPKFSRKAVYHIVQATQCHCLWHLNEKRRAQDIFKRLEVLEGTEKIEESTITACRGICWSMYHMLGSEEAVACIRRALKDNPNCDLWYFILGKNLRRIRRDSSVGSIPSDEEANAFLKAYQKSKNVLFGTFVAQMYREQRRNRLAIQMYQEILRTKPKSNTILLRLALGFMQLLRLRLAKICLDEVALANPKDGMYLHYTGRYWAKKKKIDLASQYFKKAAELGNYLAAKEYLRFTVKTNPSFNAIEYLKNLIDLYKTLPEKHIQSLLLDTAQQYWQKRDIPNTLKYYLHSIEIDSESPTLTAYYSLFQPGISQNIFHLLAKEILPAIKKDTDSLDEDSTEMIEDLESYIEKNTEKEIRSTQRALNKTKI